MTVRVIVDPDVCIGSGECVATDPEAMELDEDRATNICDVCPVGALSIER